jgi:hypothetical protein
MRSRGGHRLPQSGGRDEENRGWTPHDPDVPLTKSWPNHGVQATANSVRSCLAPAYSVSVLNNEGFVRHRARRSQRRLTPSERLSSCRLKNQNLINSL